MQAVFPQTLDTYQEYPGHLTVREGREQYFKANGIPEGGGYNQKWVQVEAWGLKYWMPNPKARKVAVPYHDLNHLLAEYPATIRGECIIAGYEVGSGIDRYWLGWLISSQAMVLGLLICPRRVYRAYVRGRHSRCTYAIVLDDAALDRTLGELREELAIVPEQKTPAGNAKHLLGFVARCAATVVSHVIPPLGVAYFLGCAHFGRKKRDAA